MNKISDYEIYSEEGNCIYVVNPLKINGSIGKILYIKSNVSEERKQAINKDFLYVRANLPYKIENNKIVHFDEIL